METKETNLVDLINGRDVIAILQHADYIHDVSAELKSGESVDFDMFIDAYKKIDPAFNAKYSADFINAISQYNSQREFVYNKKLAYDGMMALSLNLFDEELWDL